MERESCYMGGEAHGDGDAYPSQLTDFRALNICSSKPTDKDGDKTSFIFNQQQHVARQISCFSWSSSGRILMAPIHGALDLSFKSEKTEGYIPETLCYDDL